MNCLRACVVAAGCNLRLYVVWCVDVQLSTGNLIGSWFAHYKSLCGITITADNTVMITAGEDAVLHSWAIPTYVYYPFTAPFPVTLIPPTECACVCVCMCPVSCPRYHMIHHRVSHHYDHTVVTHCLLLVFVLVTVVVDSTPHHRIVCVVCGANIVVTR